MPSALRHGQLVPVRADDVGHLQPRGLRHDPFRVHRGVAHGVLLQLVNGRHHAVVFDRQAGDLVVPLHADARLLEGLLEDLFQHVLADRGQAQVAGIPVGEADLGAAAVTVVQSHAVDRIGPLPHLLAQPELVQHRQRPAVNRQRVAVHPVRQSWSTIWTDTPCLARHKAANNPTGPAPTTNTSGTLLSDMATPFLAKEESRPRIANLPSFCPFCP